MIDNSEDAIVQNIGEIARQGGISVEAVRYYEQQGLIDPPDRDTNGYRKYSSDTIQRIRFIKRAQDVGFTLKDISDLLTLKAAPGALCSDVRERAQDKLAEIDAKLAILVQMRDLLAKWTDACPRGRPVSECPILDALDGAHDNEGVA